MSIMHWIEMVAGFIVTGLGCLKGYQKYQSRQLDKKFPEKKS